MDFRNISAWSIRNPIVPIVLFIALSLAGILSFINMEIQNDPDVEFPVVIVSISQPGAAPSEIDTQITEKVESAISTVEGVDVVTSSVSEGSSQTAVQFEFGEDVDTAVNEVKAAIDGLRGDLPDGIIEPRVFKVSTSNDSFANYAVESDDMTIEQLSWFVDDTVSKRLLAVPGMSSVSRRGGVDREVRVILNPQRMQALGVTAAQVNSTLRQSNTDSGGGVAQIAGSRQSVRVLGNAKTAFELGQQQISLGGGRTIKLTDIAEVKDGNSEITSRSTVDGKPVVTFAPSRAKGESDVSVYDGAQEVMREIEAENVGVRFVELSNTVSYAKGQYRSSMAAMIEGALLAIVVVFLFLRDWRATVIAAIAIPLSAIPTFFFMDMLGFTLNTLSLLALGLVAGVLVDDAIVEIENIVRHMRMGKSAYQASIDAADEIGLAVVATTFCIVAVFLPVGVMPGIAGQFFKNFGLTVVAAVLMSLAVARMITPLAAAYFMKDHGAGDHANGRAMVFYERVLRWTLDNRVSKAMRANLTQAPMRGWYAVIAMIAYGLIAGAFGVVMYFVHGAMDQQDMPIALSIITGLAAGVIAGLSVASILRAVMQSVGGGFGRWYIGISDRFRARMHDHRVWVMGIGLASFIATLIMLVSTPVQFFPDENPDYSRVQVEMVPGTTLEQTEAVAKQVEAIVKAQPETDTVLIVANEGNATLYLTLKEDRERKSKDFESETALLFRDIPDARVNFQLNQPGRGSGSGRDISVMLSGNDPVVLKDTAVEVVRQMKGISLIKAPRLDADLQRPELIITPRADLAASLGVTTTSLSQAIRIATIGEIDQNAAKFSLSDRQVPIRVILPEDSRDKLSTIRNLPVPTADGGSVPLSRIADIRFGSGPTTIERYDRQRRVYIGADLAPGAEKGRADAAIQELPIIQNLPDGVTNTAAGTDKFLDELIGNFATALISGILLVFAVLVLLYRRLMSPLVNMGSLLLAPLGGMIAIRLIGQPISMPVFIGVLMLFGIVAKNSILLVDFAIEEMAKGEDKFVSIMEAGRKRAQPIVMTTVAMTAGMVPTAISLSGDGAWRAPMGTVVIGGLLLSTVLTLMIVPAGFSLADGFEKRAGPWMRHKFLTYKPGDEDRPLKGSGPSGPEVAPAE